MCRVHPVPAGDGRADPLLRGKVSDSRQPHLENIYANKPSVSAQDLGAEHETCQSTGAVGDAIVEDDSISRRQLAVYPTPVFELCRATASCLLSSDRFSVALGYSRATTSRGLGAAG